MRTAMGLWLPVTLVACSASSIDERGGAALDKPYETSSSKVCRDVAGTGLVSYGQNWFSSSSESWRKDGVALESIAYRANERFSSRPVEDSFQVVAETVRHGVLGPIQDRLTTYTVELTFEPEPQPAGSTSKRIETVAMKCRSFAGHSDDITTFGPAVDDPNWDVSMQAADVSYALRRILALYPTEAVEVDLARFYAPDPWEPALPAAGTWLRKVGRPDDRPSPGEVLRRPQIAFDAMELRAADSSRPYFTTEPYELEIPFRGGRPATFADVERALDTGDRDTCFLTAPRPDRSSPTQTVPAHSAELCRRGGDWDRDGDFDPRIYYVDLFACSLDAPRVGLRCLKDMTPEELSRAFGGKIRVTME